MTDLDRILGELASIRDRLQEAIDATERLELLDRREELRSDARQTSPTSPEELKKQLERLVQAWDRLQKQRIDVVKQAGDLAAGNFGFTSDAMNLNRKIDLAAGREELELRIRRLKAKLKQLESESE